MMAAEHTGYLSILLVCLCVSGGKLQLNPWQNRREVIRTVYQSIVNAHLLIADFVGYHLLHVTELLGLLGDLGHYVVEVRK